MKKNALRPRILPFLFAALLLLSCAACSGKAESPSGFRLVMHTQYSGVLIDKKGGELVPSYPDDYLLADDLSGAVYVSGGSLYYKDTKHDADKISSDCSGIVAATKDLSAVLYLSRDGDLFFWTNSSYSETDAGITPSEADKIRVRFSSDDGYAAVLYTKKGGETAIRLIDLKDCEAETAAREEAAQLIAVTEDGTVFYVSTQGMLTAADGRKETVLAENVPVAGYSSKNDLLLYRKAGMADSSATAGYFTRGTGKSDDETCLLEWAYETFPVLETPAGYGKPLSYPGQNHSYTDDYFESLMLYSGQERSDGGARLILQAADIGDGTVTRFWDGPLDDEYIRNLWFLSRKTAYLVTGGDLYYLKLSGEEWKSERLCSAKELLLTPGGVFLAADEDTVWRLDGDHAEEVTDDLGDGPWGYSEDGTALVFADGDDLYRVGEPGAKPEKIAGGVTVKRRSDLAILNGDVYYRSDDGTLRCINGKGKTEEIASHISSFSIEKAK